jgi:hypothetical protein
MEFFNFARGSVCWTELVSDIDRGMWSEGVCERGAKEIIGTRMK